jgi:hypothetical protein
MVRYIRAGYFQTVRRSRPGVYADMRLTAKVPFFALLGLFHLRIPAFGAVLS